MTTGEDLYQLQRLDSEADSNRSRLAEIASALGESKPLLEARQTLKNAQALAQKWAAQQRDLELQVHGLADKAARSEERLYSGTVRNPKELSDLQAEAASLKRRRLMLEDDLLEAMVEREDAEDAQREAQRRLDEIQALWSAQQADLLAEQADLQQELIEIEQERAALTPNIDAADLATYQDLRRRKGGLAVTRLNGDVCGVCGIAISPNLKWQLRQGELVCCNTCERIIVPP